MAENDGQKPSPALARQLGPWDLAGLMINATVGAGILGLPGKVYALAGVWCVPLCVAGGVLAALVASSFAQAGSRFMRTGGVYRFAYAAFGPAAGFATGWLTLVATLMSFAAIANLAVTYVQAIWPALWAPSIRATVITLAVVALAVPVYRGVRLSAHAHNLFTVCKLALLLAFVAVAVPALARHGLPATPVPPLRNIAPGLVLLIFALGGMEATVIGAGEMRHPARDIPFALGVGMLAIVVLYSLVFVASMALVPQLAISSRPLYDGAAAVLGPAGGMAVIAGGTISMAGVMFVILFSGPRVLFALSEQGQMPAAFAALHPRFMTPRNAVLAYSAVAWLLAVNASFLFALKIAVLTRLLLYASVAASAIRLARTGYCETAAPLQFPGGAAVSWAALLLCLAIISQSTVAEFAGVAAALAPGLALLAALRHIAQRNARTRVGHTAPRIPS